MRLRREYRVRFGSSRVTTAALKSKTPLSRDPVYGSSTGVKKATSVNTENPFYVLVSVFGISSVVVPSARFKLARMVVM